MSARKTSNQNISNNSDEIPFFGKLEENKALNQLLYYVYDDEFVLMINELSTSILNYHKSINKYFSNIRILLNKMGESSYLTAIEGNCSHLENSFKKFGEFFCLGERENDPTTLSPPLILLLLLLLFIIIVKPVLFSLFFEMDKDAFSFIFLIFSFLYNFIIIFAYVTSHLKFLLKFIISFYMK